MSLTPDEQLERMNQILKEKKEEERRRIGKMLSDITLDLAERAHANGKTLQAYRKELDDIMNANAQTSNQNISAEEDVEKKGVAKKYKRKFSLYDLLHSG